MRPVTKSLARIAFAAWISLVLLPRLAFAQDADTPELPPGPDQDAGAPAVPPAPQLIPPQDAGVRPPAAHSNSPLDDEPRPKTPANLAVGPVEQLPPSGYPEPKIRGLRNGSLWLDMQGWQWPFIPKTGIAISGYAWVDTSYESQKPAVTAAGQPLAGVVASTLSLEQARVLARITPTWSNGEYFAQGQAELVATELSPTASGVLWSADDAWVRFGKWNLFDIQLGRFQMWEVYHFGMGLDLFTFERTGAAGLGPSGGLIPDAYAETSIAQIFLRQNTLGQFAGHLYALDWLRFELGGQYGPDASGNNVRGLRPVAIADLGYLKVKGEIQLRDDKGAQDGSKLDTNEVSGGGSVEVVLDPYIEGGFNFEYASQNATKSDGTKDTGNTRHQYTFGGFVNGRPLARSVPDLMFGWGAHMTFNQDKNFDPTVDRDDEADHLQMFGAVQYLLFHQLYLKGVVAYAFAHTNPTPLSSPSVYKSEVVSGRLRLEYFF
jgi:hypothetical protein